MRRAMFIGLIALAIGLVCIGRRTSPDEPFHVDERPAPWLAAALFVGLLMLLLQSTIDMTLFQPGPWNLAMLAMGALLGLASWKATSPAASGAPVPAHAAAPAAADPPFAPALVAGIVASVAWMGAGAIAVVPIVLAEDAARSGDRAMERRNLPLAAKRYREAQERSPVSNYEYALKESTASGASPREAYAAAIAAAPRHALSWLARSRYLSSRADVAPEDAQQAIDDFTRAVELNPNDIDLRIEYADLLERFGRRGEAADQLLAALALNDQLDQAEPERLELRAPGRYEAIRSRINGLRSTTTPSQR
jgi:hypothetical protein